jgi:hypothetical protein
MAVCLELAVLIIAHIMQLVVSVVGTAQFVAQYADALLKAAYLE